MKENKKLKTWGGKFVDFHFGVPDDKAPVRTATLRRWVSANRANSTPTLVE